MGNIKELDQSIKISKLISSNPFLWDGQEYLKQVHGVGRLEGLFGMFEGQFVSSLASGYGRIIWNNKNYYEGFFKDGQMNGNGTYVDAS